MNIFKNMNRKQKREFEKMPREKQMEMFAFEMDKHYNEMAQEHITKSFYHGTLAAFHTLYDNYVKEIIEEKDKITADMFNEKIAALIVVISKYNDKYIEEFPIENNKESENK